MREKNNKMKILIVSGILIISVIMLAVLALPLKNRKDTKVSAEESSTSESVKIETSGGKTTDDTTTDGTTTDGTSAETQETKPHPAENTGNAATKTGSLSVTGTKLTDSSGNIVQLKGLSTHGLSWYPDYVNSAFFKQLREDFGINVIRLAMYTDEYNGYCTGGDKEFLKNTIDKGVSYASQNNMYAIIDWHILSDNNPNKYIDEAKAFFGEMSQKYAGHTNVIYEICNEPNGPTTWEDVKSYAVQVIDVIRVNDKDAVIIVGTPEWCQRVDSAAADPIAGYSNIMYALHFYAATHTDGLRGRMEDAIKSGLPVFVSEFGICDASGNGNIDEAQADKWVSLMDNYDVSYVMWNISNKDESSAIFNPSCSGTDGFRAEDLSRSGQWFSKLMTGGLQASNVEDEPFSTDDAVTAAEGAVNVRAEVQIKNSWTADGKTFYQYDITVTNNSGHKCSSWYADIHLDGNISISDSWNGEFNAVGDTVHITSKEYNGVLENGQSTSDIGMILSK